MKKLFSATIQVFVVDENKEIARERIKNWCEANPKFRLCSLDEVTEHKHKAEDYEGI